MLSSSVQTANLLETYSETRDRHARDEIVAAYMPLVRRVCARFRRSPESHEDLLQVGVVGLLNAIDKFDPRRGPLFHSLARPEILGAVLNYLRDHGSTIKLPRRLRRTWLQAEKASRELAVQLGHWPTDDEVARHCDVSQDQVRAAMQLGQAERVQSLDESVDFGDGRVALSEMIGAEDPGFDASLDRASIGAALRTLGRLERRVLELRFYKGLSQVETGRRVGVSQMHVSRIERAAMKKLRLLLDDVGGRELRPLRKRCPPRQADRGGLQRSGCSLPG